MRLTFAYQNECPHFPMLDNIIEDIRNQQAVLLLGHDFLPGAHTQLYRHLQQNFATHTDISLRDGLKFFYARDGLFLFKDALSKNDGRGFAAQFYRTNFPKPAETALQQITRLPFRLMVSANPDKLVADTFAKYRVPLQFDYFSANNKEEKYKTQKPDAYNPLLYNLCGSVEDEESLILDYDDLFLQIQAMLTGNNMPTDVRGVLQKARTYIFLGFHFERWQTQLFLRYLNMLDKFTNNSRNYAPKPLQLPEDTGIFLQNQFNVNFIEADFEMLTGIFRLYTAKNAEKPLDYPLRSLVDTLSATGQAVVQLVERDDLPAAFAMLKIFAPNMTDDWNKLLTMTEGEHSRLLRERDSLTVLEFNPRMAFVRNNILELAQQLK
jgi:SIR2-like domain